MFEQLGGTQIAPTTVTSGVDQPYASFELLPRLIDR